MQRKNRLSIILLLAAVPFFFCSPRTVIVRDTVPEQRPEAEILESRTALIRATDCDITVRQISSSDWDKVCSIPFFFSDTSLTTPRILPYELFFITFASTSDESVLNLRFSCKAEGIEFPAVSAAEISKRCTSKVYSSILPDQLLSLRRITTAENEFGRIDYISDTIGYPLPFILPGDTVCSLAAFPVFSPEMRKFTISVSYSIHGAKKNVDFRFIRTEHRDEE
ncbi:MAG: hypothetical protein ACRCUT_04560 [Spirochaetota bacterium]